MPYKYVFHLQIFKNTFVNCLQLASPEVGSGEDSCGSDLQRRCSQEKPARGGGAAATAAQQPSTEGGLRLEPLEAKRSETGGWTHRTPEPAPRLVWVQH